MPELKTAAVMQGLIKNAPGGPEADKLKKGLEDVLNPADNKGGLMSFPLLATFASILVLVFGIIWFLDRRKGAYKAEAIH